MGKLVSNCHKYVDCCRRKTIMEEICFLILPSDTP